MAYTYDDFKNAATNAGMLNRFSKHDLDTATRSPEYGLSLLGLFQDEAKADTAEKRLLATEAANQLRKNYGVYATGDRKNGYAYAGSYGSKINGLLDNIDNYGSFDYKNQDAYQQLLDSVANPQKFEYDPATDPVFGAYKKAYLREGDRASANVLAQAAASNGGRASSYALNAAQQAGNYYAAQLSDQIPALKQQAYNQYLDEFNRKMSSLGALEADRNFDYENWMTEYNRLQNSLGNYQTQDEIDYQRYLDGVAREQQIYNDALNMYQLLGYATPEIAEILGIDPSEPEKKYYWYPYDDGNGGDQDGSSGDEDDADTDGTGGDGTKIKKEPFGYLRSPIKGLLQPHLNRKS